MEKVCINIGHTFEVCKNENGEAWVETFPESFSETRELTNNPEVSVYIDDEEVEHYDYASDVPPSISKDIIEFIKEATKPNDRNIEKLYDIALSEALYSPISGDIGGEEYIIESLTGIGDEGIDAGTIGKFLDFAEEHNIQIPEEEYDIGEILEESFMYDLDRIIDDCAKRNPTNMEDFIQCIDFREEYMSDIYDYVYSAWENKYAYEGMKAICKAIEEYPEDFKREFGNDTYQKVRNLMC